MSIGNSNPVSLRALPPIEAAAQTTTSFTPPYSMPLSPALLSGSSSPPVITRPPSSTIMDPSPPDKEGKYPHTVHESKAWELYAYPSQRA